MTASSLRKDAAKRRIAILAADRQMFEEQGIDAPLDGIAERAGVGRATLYRNFSGRTEIALAVLIDDVAELGRLFADPVEPGSFFSFLAALSDRLARNIALGGAVRAAPSPESLAPLRKAMRQAAMPALRISQAAGLVRADLTPDDIRVLAAMLAGGLHNASLRERNAIARRSLELVLDAVRART